MANDPFKSDFAALRVARQRCDVEEFREVVSLLAQTLAADPALHDTQGQCLTLNLKTEINRWPVVQRGDLAEDVMWTWSKYGLRDDYTFYWMHAVKAQALMDMCHPQESAEMTTSLQDTFDRARGLERSLARAWPDSIRKTAHQLSDFAKSVFDHMPQAQKDALITHIFKEAQERIGDQSIVFDSFTQAESHALTAGGDIFLRLLDPVAALHLPVQEAEARVQDATCYSRYIVGAQNRPLITQLTKAMQRFIDVQPTHMRPYLHSIAFGSPPQKPHKQKYRAAAGFVLAETSTLAPK